MSRRHLVQQHRDSTLDRSMTTSHEDEEHVQKPEKSTHKSASFIPPSKSNQKLQQQLDTEDNDVTIENTDVLAYPENMSEQQTMEKEVASILSQHRTLFIQTIQKVRQLINNGINIMDNVEQIPSSLIDQARQCMKLSYQQLQRDYTEGAIFTFSSMYPGIRQARKIVDEALDALKAGSDRVIRLLTYFNQELNSQLQDNKKDAAYVHALATSYLVTVSNVLNIVEVSSVGTFRDFFIALGARTSALANKDQTLNRQLPEPILNTNRCLLEDWITFEIAREFSVFHGSGVYQRTMIIYNTILNHLIRPQLSFSTLKNTIAYRINRPINMFGTNIILDRIADYLESHIEKSQQDVVNLVLRALRVTINRLCTLTKAINQGSQLSQRHIDELIMLAEFRSDENHPVYVAIQKALASADAHPFALGRQGDPQLSDQTTSSHSNKDQQISSNNNNTSKQVKSSLSTQHVEPNEEEDFDDSVQSCLKTSRQVIEDSSNETQKKKKQDKSDEQKQQTIIADKKNEPSKNRQVRAQTSFSKMMDCLEDEFDKWDEMLDSHQDEDDDINQEVDDQFAAIDKRQKQRVSFKIPHVDRRQKPLKK